MSALRLRPRDLATQQAAASVGQGMLIAAYTAAFAQHGLTGGQVLLTADDLMRRAHYRNAQRGLDRLLDLGILPIVNENDTVATDEIRFGDNDRLAALVAQVVHADALVLLSDVDALYDGPPERAGAARIDEVRDFAELDSAEIGGTGAAGVGLGGMATKVDAARIATKYFADDTELGPAVARLASDADAQVRLQVACTLGDWRDPRAGAALAHRLGHFERGLVAVGGARVVHDDIDRTKSGLCGLDQGAIGVFERHVAGDAARQNA